MIYIFNLMVSFFCLISIIILLKYPKLVQNNSFYNHYIIFILKVLFISMFIYIFIYNFSISNYKIFIISGGFNLTFFHVLEGYLTRKILLKDETKT